MNKPKCCFSFHQPVTHFRMTNGCSEGEDCARWKETVRGSCIAATRLFPCTHKRHLHTIIYFSCVICAKIAILFPDKLHFSTKCFGSQALDMTHFHLSRSTYLNVCVCVTFSIPYTTRSFLICTMLSSPLKMNQPKETDAKCAGNIHTHTHTFTPGKKIYHYFEELFFFLSRAIFIFFSVYICSVQFSHVLLPFFFNIFSFLECMGFFQSLL